MPDSKIFRDVSIERLSSPEQLDRLLPVTSLRGWVALGALGLLLVAAGVWAAVGTLPSTVAGSGVLTQSGGVTRVVAPEGGRVTDVAVRAGESVDVGQVVARLRQPERLDALREAEEALSRLKQQQRRQTAFEARDADLRGDVLNQRRQRLAAAVTASESQVTWFEEKVKARQTLLDRGLITRQQLVDVQQRLTAEEQRLRELRTELDRLDVERLSLQNEKWNRRERLEEQVAQTKQRIRALEADVRRSSEIVSPHAGRVLEVVTERNALLGRGAPVMRMHQMGRDVRTLEVVFYVSALQGKQIQSGMDVQIEPAMVKAAEYGRMLGTVTYVSDFPVSSERVATLVENEQLAGALTQGGAPYEVHARVRLDETTQSGYAWTSSEGPPLAIQSGTLCRVEVRVREQRPLDLIVPALREWVDGGSDG